LLTKFEINIYMKYVTCHYNKNINKKNLYLNTAKYYTCRAVSVP